ncbi:MAG TPA: hypothetical protein VIU93_06350 [Gallionellaceae bacterium]
MTKLDDASWHLGSDDFPEGAPEENSATHMGMFVAWAVDNDLWGQVPGVDWAVSVAQVRSRKITGRTFVLEECDGKLFSEMFNERGAAFAESYYDRYLMGYQCTLTKGLASDYLVADTWENYERMAGVLTARYENPKPLTKPWWKFW